MQTPYLAAPVSTTPAVCVLSNHGSPLTASPGLPISRWWSSFSPVLSQHCATGIGASSPVHAAVVAPRSDWTALSETSSGEHPCRHDNLPISRQGCVCERVELRGGCFRASDWNATTIHFYTIVTSLLASPLSIPSGLSQTASLRSRRTYWTPSGTICASTTSCPIRVSQLNVSHHRTPNQLKRWPYSLFRQM